MRLLSRHGLRIAVTLIPLVFALLHASGLVPLGLLQRLDHVIYDARLRATMPQTLDERIVIVDIDEKSLAEVGRWPWSRNKLAALVDELHGRQSVALLGFDIVFAEPDDSSGLKRLQQLADAELKDQPGFLQQLKILRPSLDHDAAFARALENRPVVMGYYFTRDGGERVSGTLPPPTLPSDAFQAHPGAAAPITRWTGYGANLDRLAKAAPAGGFFNSLTDGDGVVRSLPLLAVYKDQYYASLSLAMFRAVTGLADVVPGFSADGAAVRSVVLKGGGAARVIPVDDRVATLIPFRGPGGPRGSSFRYVSAADVLAQRLAPDTLKGKIVLLGATAPGLLDLRVTPVGETFPGVEVHANVISGFLDGRVLVQPDYATGFEVLQLLLAGLMLAFALPLLSAPRAVAASVAVVGVLLGLNFLLFSAYGLVLPLASALAMALSAFALNMSYGYFVESRAKRELAQLFGTYVPPELVDEMVKDPDRYSMQASTRELTVMFCDMRGFTKMSESMDPAQLQALLNGVFSRLTGLIRHNRGTIDKYMGDCVMAFWGAPVDTPDHAPLAVKTALEMSSAVRQLNEEHKARGLPEFGIGIGLNTGSMCVGDMGSDVRRSYTVIGDAVNLGSRLEGLCKTYGVEIVASESTRQRADGFVWQELDKVRVQGKDQAVAIFSPMPPASPADAVATAHELARWNRALQAYRAQDWAACAAQLADLQRLNAKKCLYRLYAERVALGESLPFNSTWDGVTHFETK